MQSHSDCIEEKSFVSSECTKQSWLVQGLVSARGHLAQNRMQGPKWMEESSWLNLNIDL